MTTEPILADIIRVIDGDTFLVLTEMGDRERIRVSAIDAFDATLTAKTRSQAQRAGISPQTAKHIGNQARLFATLKLTGKTVLLVKHPNDNDKDNFGRYIRQVWLDEYNTGNYDTNFASLLETNNYLAPL